MVSDRGLESLSIDELIRLRMLLEDKDYGNDRKAGKSKSKLLKKINFAIFDKYNRNC
jgi:hypothetical protein